jgi:hypothetical protein
MPTAQSLINDVKTARNLYIEQVTKLSTAQAESRPAPEAWNITEITEHLFWAEHNGLCGMWAALEEIRSGQKERSLASPHRDMSIDQVIQLTWRTKEKVPEGAGPRQGGPLPFWRESLINLQHVLDAFGSQINPDELRLQAYPHPISGALDFHQRLEFLRFHILRHRDQVANILRQQSAMTGSGA